MLLLGQTGKHLLSLGQLGRYPPLASGVSIDPRIIRRTDTERLSYDVVCLDSCQAFPVNGIDLIRLLK